MSGNPGTDAIFRETRSTRCLSPQTLPRINPCAAVLELDFNAQIADDARDGSGFPIAVRFRPVMPHRFDAGAGC